MKLPSTMRDHPYLQEFYGTVEWSSKEVFNHYMGWFGGKITYVHKVPPGPYADLMIRLAKNGETEILEKAKMAFDDEDFKWSARLSDFVIKGGKKSSNILEAKVLNEKNNIFLLLLFIHQFFSCQQLKAKCLRKLAEEETSANGRNWYLTAALVLDGFDPSIPDEVLKVQIRAMSMENLLKQFIVRVDPLKCEEEEEMVHFQFTKPKEDFILKVNDSTFELLYA